MARPAVPGLVDGNLLPGVPQRDHQAVGFVDRGDITLGVEVEDEAGNVAVEAVERRGDLAARLHVEAALQFREDRQRPRHRIAFRAQVSARRDSPGLHHVRDGRIVELDDQFERGAALHLCLLIDSSTPHGSARTWRNLLEQAELACPDIDRRASVWLLS